MNAALLSREKTFLAACAVLLAASGAGTIYLCRSMSGGMEMPGGWTMSMVWMRMPGQSWVRAAAMFLGMWVVMMMAMMLPSLFPTLWNYRRHVGNIGTVHSAALTVLAGASYFLVWAFLGAAAYGAGAVVTSAEMRSFALARYAPAVTGAVLFLAGCFQLTGWKARLLARCRDVHACHLQAEIGPGSACRQGIRWGMDCSLCCLGFMVVLLVTGVMNMASMAILAAAIAIERTLPNPQRSARIAGIVIIVAAAFVIARVTG